MPQTPSDRSGRSDPNREKPIEQLVDEARVENPDPTTQRETLELDLMEEERSAAGADVQIEGDS